MQDGAEEGPGDETPDADAEVTVLEPFGFEPDGTVWDDPGPATQAHDPLPPTSITVPGPDYGRPIYGPTACAFTTPRQVASANAVIGLLAYVPNKPER